MTPEKHSLKPPPFSNRHVNIARWSLTAMLLFGLFAVTPVCGQDLEKRTSQYGAITGRIVLPEEIPTLEPLIRKHADVKDAEVCSAETVPNEELVVDPKTKGVSNTFIWLGGFDPKLIHPDLKEKELKPTYLTFQGCRFRPHAMCVQVRQTFKVRNLDPITHLPHEFPFRNEPACVVVGPASNNHSSGFVHPFKQRESVPIPFKCDYHPWMTAYVLVQDHPYMTVSETNGSFQIENVPFGDHKLCIWHETGGYLVRKSVILDKKKLSLGEVQLKLSTDDRKRLNLVIPTKSQSNSSG